MSLTNVVHVAVAVIKNQHGQILIAKRPRKSHQGGLWEFPGGKVEKNETVLEALKREIFEEVGITLIQAKPLIRIPHNYKDKAVLLDVWSIDKFSGKAFGKEGQDTCWVRANNLIKYTFPAANITIIKSINLPDEYMITGLFTNESELQTKVKNAIKNGVNLIQFRAHEYDDDTYFKYAKNLYSICTKKHTKLLLNRSLICYEQYNAAQFSDGIHLSSIELRKYKINNENVYIVAASVHNLEELSIAQNKGVDFVVLSPVQETLSHPCALHIGWNEFYRLTEQTKLPVYALGGMHKSDVDVSKKFGGQGISGISTFWS